MSILTLPNEILQRIISLVGPETFEEIVLVCKRLYHASSPFLKEHNVMRKRFRHFRFSSRDDSSLDSVSSEQDAAEAKAPDEDEDGEQDSIVIHSVLELLQYIARHPVVARYMISADLSHDALGETVYDAQEAEKPLIVGDTAGILRLLQASPYLNKRGYDPSAWLEAMEQTMDGHADVFLLTLLPNVEELVISGRMADSSYYVREDQDGQDGKAASPILQCRSVLEDIVDDANQNPQSDAALSRLRVVENNCLEDDDYDTKNDLTAVSSLLAIRSVCRFYGSSFVAMEDGYTGIGFHPRYKRLSPNLEQVVLECSILGALSASKLFSRIDNLKVFRLSWTVKYHGCGFNWDTGAMLHSLQQAAGDTLEELSIHDKGGTNMKGTVPVTMTAFSCLRVFESDFEFFCDEPFDRARQPEELEDDAEPGNIYNEGEDMPNGKVAPFVDFFPETIERIFFSVSSWHDVDQQHVAHLFDRMHEERATKLPRLKDISFVIPNPKEATNLVFPVTADMLPSLSEQTKSRDTLVALIMGCGGTVETKDWWYPGKTWKAA